MRSFQAKILACMVLVPILARGGGMLLEATLNDLRPQSERTLAMAMPAVAALATASLARGGEPALAAALGQSGNVLRLVPKSAKCARADGARLIVALPGNAATCIAGQPPPRPLVLGIVPASWWFLLPVLELLCCGVISYFLARYLAAPILRTRHAAAAFAAGDLTARAAAAPRRARRDEAADLEREFNRMADRVSLIIAAQQRFIGDVSHEIRSPLARLALALALVRRDTPSTLLPRLDRMEMELDSVSNLVNELLVLASLQGSVAPPKSDMIDLCDILDRVIETLTFEFHERGEPIRAIRRSCGVIVRGDAGLLRRAVDNVLRNALFYTPDHTEVETLIESDAGWARLVVRDHGPGVPESALPQLFEPFFRVDSARARHTGGAGLGLAISRRAVELHGGRITAANGHPHGLTMRIELPLATDLRANSPRDERPVELA